MYLIIYLSFFPCFFPISAYFPLFLFSFLPDFYNFLSDSTSWRFLLLISVANDVEALSFFFIFSFFSFFFSTFLLFRWRNILKSSLLFSAIFSSQFFFSSLLSFLFFLHFFIFLHVFSFQNYDSFFPRTFFSFPLFPHSLPAMDKLAIIMHSA